MAKPNDGPRRAQLSALNYFERHLPAGEREALVRDLVRRGVLPRVFWMRAHCGGRFEVQPGDDELVAAAMARGSVPGVVTALTRAAQAHQGAAALQRENKALRSANKRLQRAVSLHSSPLGRLARKLRGR